MRQQLFFVDIDNDEKHADGKKYRTAHPISSHDDILRISRAAGLEPAIIAESFSSGKTDPNGDPIPKYHVIFAAAEPIQTTTEARHVLTNLLGVFGGADEALKDPARILFGSPADKPLYVQNVTNSPAALLSCYTAPEPEPAQPAELPAPAPTSRSSSPAPRRPEEADPDYLLSMIDVNLLEYPEWRRVSAAYKVAGGSLEIWEQWSGQYTGGKKSTQEQARENRATWKGLTGKGVTKGSLKRFAKQHSPAEYDSYIQALTPSKSTRSKSKRKTQSAAPETETQTETAAEQFGGSQTVEEPAGELLEITEGGSPQWVPLEFPEWLEKPANYVDFAFIDEKDKVHIVAYLLADNVRKTSNYIFVRGANPSEPVRRFWYIGGVYRPVNDEYIKNKIRERLEVFGAIHCKKTYIEEAFYQLCLDECYHTDSELNADPALINFENGVLNINTLELTPHTPELLSTVQIPCNYVPGLELKDCPTFTQFISRLANYDNDSTAALIEYIGAVISNVDGSRFKKALFLRGAGNCGKSKYIELLRRLLSDEYYATASLEKLESRFGAYSLYNRRLIGDPDIKYLKVSELNTFKQATGGDPLQLEQKGKMPFSFKYSGFMIFGCNELPLFGGDNGKWVYDVTEGEEYKVKVIDNVGNITESEPISITKIMKLQEIKIKQPADKTEYEEGEDFNSTGMKIEAKYDNGQSEEVSGYEIVNGRNLQKGQTSVRIRYTEKGETKEIEHAITVVQKKEELRVEVREYETIKEEGKNYIENIKANTSIEEIKSNIRTNGTIEIYKGDTKITENNKFLGTGMEIRIKLDNEEKRLTAIVKGDMTGDGKMSISDLLRLSRYAAGIDKNISIEYLKASDVVEGGKYGSISDIAKMSRVIAKMDSL